MWGGYDSLSRKMISREKKKKGTLYLFCGKGQSAFSFIRDSYTMLGGSMIFFSFNFGDSVV